MNSISFTNRVVKQGNSLCVRIPKLVVKEFELAQGDEVLLTVAPKADRYRSDSETIDRIVRIAQRIPKLEHFDETKHRIFAMLNFSFLEQTRDRDVQKQREKEQAFFEGIREEYGDRFADELIEWGMTVNKEAFTMDGSAAILNEEFRE